MPAGDEIGAQRGVAEDALDLPSELARVVWVEVERRVAADLRERRRARRDRGDAVGHRFAEGKAEAFVDRGEDEELRAAVDRGQARGVEVVVVDDAALAEARRDRSRLPADLADDDERAVVVDRLEGVEEHGKVLARLDGGDEEDVAAGEGRVAAPHPAPARAPPPPP